MRVIKKINNNVALCVDDNNNELIAFGKGIGFQAPPYDIELSQISRTYYGVNKSYISMINELPEKIIELSGKIVEYASIKLDNLNNPNLVFTLVDHINFTIERYKKNISVKLPIFYDIQYLYDVEMEIAGKALALIKKELGIVLPKDEAAGIAIHIINAEFMNKSLKRNKLDEEIIEEITGIIENYFDIKIEKRDFSYSRFVTHMHYFLRRGRKKEFISDENKEMYDSIIKSLPQNYECCKQIEKYLKDSLHWELTDQESMYLVLHIYRLSLREDCFKG